MHDARALRVIPHVPDGQRRGLHQRRRVGARSRVRRYCPHPSSFDRRRRSLRRQTPRAIRYLTSYFIANGKKRQVTLIYSLPSAVICRTMNKMEGMGMTEQAHWLLAHYAVWKESVMYTLMRARASCLLALLAFIVCAVLTAPLRASTSPPYTISYTLSNPGRVSLNIYDVNGHVVRELLHADQEASGAHNQTWDGNDNHGNAVSNSNTCTWMLLETPSGLHAEYLQSLSTLPFPPPLSPHMWPAHKIAPASPSILARAASRWIRAACTWAVAAPKALPMPLKWGWMAASNGSRHNRQIGWAATPCTSWTARCISWNKMPMSSPRHQFPERRHGRVSLRRCGQSSELFGKLYRVLLGWSLARL